MQTVLQNAFLIEKGRIVCRDVILSHEGMIDTALNSLNSCFLFPGFADVHVHLREPGFSYKETIAKGTRAAAHGGYCAVCAMPNLNPVPDTKEHLREQLDIIHRDASVRVYPYGAITMGEKGETLSDMAEIAPDIIAFSDDGRGVQSDAMMREAMLQAKELGKMICAHCEDNSLLHGGYIHAGRYAAEHGHRGISSESEWRQIERDLRLAKETGCAYHVCHISTKESVALIRAAKKEGVDVTCETGPHYLVMTEDDLRENGNFKMNPPLRSRADRDALIEGILDGTIDMIATDHAPHSLEEKSRGLEKSAMGIVGLETAFSVLYTKLVKTKILPLGKLIELMHDAPCKRFHIDLPMEKNYTVFDLSRQWTVNPEMFCSQGRNTPFAGWKLDGKCLLTVADGKVVWNDTNK